MGDIPDLPNHSDRSFSERRKAPRHAFVATTAITDVASEMRFTGTVTEISRTGCYVDILNTPPLGTVVNVHISCDHGTFIANGKVLYVHERIGMGVVFLDPPKDQMDILESWLVTLPPLST